MAKGNEGNKEGFFSYFTGIFGNNQQEKFEQLKTTAQEFTKEQKNDQKNLVNSTEQSAKLNSGYNEINKSYRNQANAFKNLGKYSGVSAKK